MKAKNVTIESINRSEIIGKLTGHPEVTKKLATEVMDLFFEIIRQHFKQGGRRVLLTGLGSLHIQHRKAHETVHPQDKTKRITIPARKAITFKASDDLMSLINRR